MSGNAAEKVSDVIEQAKARFDVVITTPTTLLIDIDTPLQLRQYERIMNKFSGSFGMTERERWKSKDGGTHIVVDVDCHLQPVERIALQACLGSDPVREMLGLKHIENEVDEFSFLFRPRSAA